MSFLEKVQQRYVAAGDIVNLRQFKVSQQLHDLDLAFIAFVLNRGKNKLSTITMEIQKIGRTDQMYLKSLLDKFNVTTPAGLAGEIMEYEQNHPADVHKYDPKGEEKFGENVPRIKKSLDQVKQLQTDLRKLKTCPHSQPKKPNLRIVE